MSVNSRLLTNTEPPEHLGQHVVRHRAPGDSAERILGEPQLFSHELPTGVGRVYRARRQQVFQRFGSSQHMTFAGTKRPHAFSRAAAQAP